MDNAEIYQKLTELMRSVFDDDEVTAVPELTAKDVEGWDSLSNLRFMLSVERAFGIKFSAAEVGKLKNMGELVSVIKTKVR